MRLRFKWDKFERQLRVAALTGVILSGCGTAALPQDTQPEILADVRVLRNGTEWTADFIFHRDSPVWLFLNSAVTRESREPWRLRSWVVETPGVRLERRGSHDVLFAAVGGPVPRAVRVRFTPFAEGLDKAYTPALIFTDGSVALYTDQFDMAAVATLAEAATLPMDLNGVDLDDGPARVTFQDRAGPVLLHGERRESPIAIDGRSYALFGSIPVRETSSLAMVIDPALPSWIGNEMAEFTPRLVAFYGERLKVRVPNRPTILVSWAGPTPSLRSMGGGTLPGLLAIAFEGDGVVSSSPELLSMARLFIAHEAAHFAHVQLRNERARDAWITEGAADLLAVRGLSALDSDYAPLPRLQTELDECVRFATAKAIFTAAERGEQRAYYSCGVVLGLVAEAAARRTGGDFFSFMAALIDANLADGVLTTDDWFAQFARWSDDPTIAADIRSMLETGVPDPGVLIASMFVRSGVRHEVRDGRVILTGAATN